MARRHRNIRSLKRGLWAWGNARSAGQAAALMAMCAPGVLIPAAAFVSTRSTTYNILAHRRRADAEKTQIVFASRTEATALKSRGRRRRARMATKPTRRLNLALDATQSQSIPTLLPPQQRPTTSPAHAEHELLELVRRGSFEEEDERVATLVDVLEQGYTPIQTIPFYNMAVQGKWRLAYTNAPMPPIGPRLTVLEQFQRIEPGDHNEGALTNVLAWSLDDENVSGRLEVKCEYALNPRGLLDLRLLEHLLIPEDKMPRDPKGLIALLQRAMPYEMFNPDEGALETTFMDESVRIVRMRGQRHQGRLNIFIRDTAPLREPALEGGGAGDAASVASTCPSDDQDMAAS